MLDLELGQKLSGSAREYANVAVAAFTVSGSVHTPTVIAACARMAGTSLFRSFGLDVNGVQPGQPVLSAEADEHWPMLILTTAGILANLGITMPESPTGAVVDDRMKPLQGFLETQRLLEPLFLPVQSKYALNFRQAAQGAAIATALLIHHFAKHIEPAAAFGLAAFVEGAKTAPDPIILSNGNVDLSVP